MGPELGHKQVAPQTSLSACLPGYAREPDHPAVAHPGWHSLLTLPTALQ